MLRSRFILVFFCLLLFSSALPAQNLEDSLRKELAKPQEDSNRVKLLIALAENQMFSNPDSSLRYSEKAYDLARQSLNVEAELAALNKIGRAYWSKGNLREGLKYFLQSLQMAEKVNMPEYIALNESSIGLIFSGSGLYTKAIDYYKRSLPYYQRVKNNERKATLYNNIGKGFLNMQVIDSAEYYFLRSDSVKRTYNINLPITSFNLADLYFQQGKLSESLIWIVIAEAESHTRNDRRALIRCYQLRAEIALQQGELLKAERLAKQAVENANATNIKELIYITYRTYSSVLHQQKKHEIAYDYFEKYTHYRDSLQSINTQNSLLAYEFLLSEQEIKNLKAQQKIEQENRDKERLIMSGLIILTIVIASLAYYLFRSREQRKKLNQRLSEQNQAISQQNLLLSDKAEKLAALNNFRNTILSVITHDLRGPFTSLQNLLNSSVKEKLTNEDVEIILFELSKQLRTITSLTDTLLAWGSAHLDNYHITLKSIDLCEFFNQQLNFFEDNAKAKKIQIINSLSSSFVIRADENILSVIIRNFISNALKYCGAEDRIRLEASKNEGDIFIEVSDTGPGIPKEVLAGLLLSPVQSRVDNTGYKGAGIGLVLCSELAKRLNGSISFKSEEGKGTKAILRFPLSEVLNG